MKKTFTLLIVMILFLCVGFSCSESTPSKQKEKYYLDEQYNLIEVYTDSSIKNLGNFDQYLKDYSNNVSIENGYYVISNIKTDIKEIIYYTVKFITNTEQSISDLRVKEGSIINEPIVKKDGYTFKGWYKDSIKWNFELDKVTSDITLVAVFEKIPSKYTISFTDEFGIKLDNILVTEGEAYSLPKLTKDGYIFNGWLYNGKLIDSTEAYSFGKDITLKSSWDKATYFIKFNTDGGNIIDDIPVKSYSEITSLPTPVKDNFNFLGWMKDGKVITLPYQHTFGNLILTAKWEEIKLPEPEPKPEPSDKEEELRKYDPYYPVNFTDTPYLLTSPKLEGRFFINSDKTKGTFFAPGVTKTSGFKDANKYWTHDKNHCWAASVSNLISWYLDRCSELNYDLTGVTRSEQEIFKVFGANWADEGSDQVPGLSWYFINKFPSGSAPDNLKNKNSGGYLSHLPGVGSFWSILDPVNHYSIVGDRETMTPILEDCYSLGNTHKAFSKKIIEQLHFGPGALTVIKPNSSAVGSHAITLWGCEFDLSTGLIDKIYITDSDDEGIQKGPFLRELGVKGITGNDYYGAELNGYYLPYGDSSEFKYITGSVNLFNPGIVSYK